MPLLHVVATAAIVVLCLRACFSTWHLLTGRARARGTAEYIAMIVVCLLVVWQASTWLGGDHADAAAGFRAAVWIQLVSAAIITALTTGSLAWAKVRGGGEGRGRRPGPNTPGRSGADAPVP